MKTDRSLASDLLDGACDLLDEATGKIKDAVPLVLDSRGELELLERDLVKLASTFNLARQALERELADANTRTRA